MRLYNGFYQFFTIFNDLTSDKNNRGIVLHAFPRWGFYQFSTAFNLLTFNKHNRSDLHASLDI